MRDVFIAYKHEDQARVKRLVEALQKQGLSVWWDVDLQGGGHWRQGLEEALNHARCVLVMWTHASTGPDGSFVIEEATRAAKRKILVPVLLDKVEAPLGFGEVQSIDLSTWRGSGQDENFKRLVHAIQAKLDGIRPRPAQETSTAASKIPLLPTISMTRTLPLQRRHIVILVSALLCLVGLYFVAQGYWRQAAPGSMHPTDDKPQNGAAPTSTMQPGAPAAASAAVPTAVVEKSCEEILTEVSKLNQRSVPAPDNQNSPATLREPLATTAMGLPSGPGGLTYYRMAADLADVARSQGLSLMPLETGGTLDNISQLAGPENAGVGFVQSDVGIFLPHSDNPKLKANIGKLGLIMALHTEEVHVLARKHIKTWADLANQRVVVAKNSQGSQVTARNLYRLTGARTDRLEYSTLPLVEATCAVIKGHAAAMLVTAGKPVPLLTAIAALPSADRSSVHLLPIPFAPDSVYDKVELPAGTYPWQSEAVPTLSVRALLIAYDFSDRASAYRTKRCNDVHLLKRILDKEISALKQNQNAHEKWRDTFNHLSVSNWRLDRCAHPSARI